jgi:hypothetical protein
MDDPRAGVVEALRRLRCGTAGPRQGQSHHAAIADAARRLDIDHGSDIV